MLFTEGGGQCLWRLPAWASEYCSECSILSSILSIPSRVFHLNIYVHGILSRAFKTYHSSIQFSVYKLYIVVYRSMLGIGQPQYVVRLWDGISSYTFICHRLIRCCSVYIESVTTSARRCSRLSNAQLRNRIIRWIVLFEIVICSYPHTYNLRLFLVGHSSRTF